MRLPVSAILLMTTLAFPVQGSPGWTEITFVAPVPCAVACPDWLGNLNHDVDGDGAADVYFDPCGSPAPWTKGRMYDDVLTDPIPQGADVLIFDLFPSVDFDAFICEYRDTWDEDGTPNESLAEGGIPVLFPNCHDEPGPDDPIPEFGCRERLRLAAKAGKQVILRAYNVSDPTGEATGRYMSGDV